MNGGYASKDMSAPVCLNCLHLIGERNYMVQTSDTVYTCLRCRSVKELILVRRMLILSPAGLVVSGVSIGATLYAAILPVLSVVPLSALLAPFVLAAYLYIGLMFTLKASGVERRGAIGGAGHSLPRSGSHQEAEMGLEAGPLVHASEQGKGQVQG